LAWGIPIDVPVAGSICRLIAQKGLDTALDAFAGVVGKVPGAHYVIAGDGKLRAELESQVRRLALEKSVHFLGWRSDNHAIYDAIDAFVLPSRWEGFGLVLLEAMGHGLPVIGSTAGAIPEVVVDGETGYLSAAEDVAALGESMERVLGDAGLRKKMGKAGRKRLETVFSVGKMVEETIGFYEGVVKGQNLGSQTEQKRIIHRKDTKSAEKD
jgi:glycosyltransferase involved in cell wall biosynthesis